MKPLLTSLSLAADIWAVTTAIRVWHSDIIQLEKTFSTSWVTVTLNATGESRYLALPRYHSPRACR